MEVNANCRHIGLNHYFTRGNIWIQNLSYYLIFNARDSFWSKGCGLWWQRAGVNSLQSLPWYWNSALFMGMHVVRRVLCVSVLGACVGDSVCLHVFMLCVCVSASACHLLLLSVSNPESCCPALPSPFYGSEYAKVMFFFLSISQSLRNGNFFLQITP